MAKHVLEDVERMLREDFVVEDYCKMDDGSIYYCFGDEWCWIYPEGHMGRNWKVGNMCWDAGRGDEMKIRRTLSKWKPCKR